MNRLKQISAHLTGFNFKMSDDASHVPLLSKEEESIFFGHDTVNRLSFLREDSEFIKQAITHKQSKIVILVNDAPLGYTSSHQLYYSGYDELRDTIDDWIVLNRDEDIKVNDIRITFLGIDEKVTLDEIEFKYGEHYRGIPYFGFDISNNADLQATFINSEIKPFSDRKEIMKMSNFDSSIFSHAKMYLDWINRNLFCAGCGSRDIVIHAGTKLKCSSLDKHIVNKTEVFKCPVKSARVSNVSFPRTDSVIITAITNKSFDKILLGRGKRFPLPTYSCIAGFIEPSETIEVASAREIWEETGARASKIQILKSQPWPYPANLMIGCVAFVDFNGKNEVINLGHDPELLDAQWFEITEIKKKLAGDTEGWQLPPKTAIAHSLIEYVVQKYDNLNQK
ncbi:hypothetical protein WICMUC_005157 [Wickerhamomyces mucosus]|uniref:NAD(+) diphosphatase n=1 Tax=Wickerhamomyces mucosus TaxID=1378264 RepID=A0A9P8T6X1_9ASCO|nr:hypothetical protein WICMUC_005157 [Wickerhamomyces mucosus]